MEETISLKEIFQTLRKRLAMIVIITLVATALSAFVTYVFITPKYEATAQILVNQSNSDQQNPGVDYNQLQTNVKLINTYSVIIKSPRVLDDVVKSFDDVTEGDLKDRLTINSAQDSQVFNVTLQDTDPALAVKLVNKVAKSFEDKVQDVMKVDNVTVLSPAELSKNPAPVSPSPALNMAIAFVVGLMISVGLAFLLEFLDNTIKTEEDIEKQLELPVLGAIVEMSAEDTKVVKRKPTQSEKLRSGSIEA